MDEVNLRQQKLNTRIYIILFTSCLCVLLFYTAIVERSAIKIHTIFSIEDYEHLLDVYSDGVICPCTRISIPYSDLVTELRVDVFHQACSTALIWASMRAGKYAR